MTLRNLQEQGLIGSPEQGIEILETAKREENSTPLLARIALVLGAWLSGIFLAIAFGLLFNDIFDEELAATSIGLLAIVGSIFLFRKTKGLFLEQLALAINLAGTCLFLLGLANLLDLRNEVYSVLAGTIILCPFVFFFSRNGVQQFLSLSWVYLMGWIAGFAEKNPILVVAALTIGIGAFFYSWLARPNAVVNRSITYSSLLSVITALFLISSDMGRYWEGFIESVTLYSRILVPLAVGGALSFVTFRGDTRRPLLISLGLTLLFLAISWAGAPGVAFAIGLMILAHQMGDRLFAGLSPVLLGGFLILFYYYLGVPLLTKSFWLMGIGAALLLSCLGIFRVLRPRLSS